MVSRDKPRIFVSYKSENAQFVRAVVEQLMLLGVDLWFAEYDLLSSDHVEMEDVYDRVLENAGIEEADKKYKTLIHRKLQKSILPCTHGLIFTNRTWADSDFCLQELKWLKGLFGNNNSRLTQTRLPRVTLPILAIELLDSVLTLEQPATQPDIESVTNSSWKKFR